MIKLIIEEGIKEYITFLKKIVPSPSSIFNFLLITFLWIINIRILFAFINKEPIEEIIFYVLLTISIKISMIISIMKNG